LDWFFFNTLKLYFFNLIILFPLGVYLALLFNIKSLRKATLIVFLVSLTIETYQIIFGYFGLVWGRSFNIDDLILNTLGGAIGFLVMLSIKSFFHSRKVKIF